MSKNLSKEVMNAYEGKPSIVKLGPAPQEMLDNMDRIRKLSMAVGENWTWNYMYWNRLNPKEKIKYEEDLRLRGEENRKAASYESSSL